MAAGELGQDAAGLGEADVGALADGLVAEAWRRVSSRRRALSLVLLLTPLNMAGHDVPSIDVRWPEELDC
ncbi:hypothetical protein [Streptomyces canus]|uniref:hypothetical protein n=1 Tax=Streptomyces canus TaxID=58343 RepID=UPI00371EA02A